MWTTWRWEEPRKQGIPAGYLGAFLQSSSGSGYSGGFPPSLYEAEAPAIQRSFQKARERFASALAALGMGNIKARKEGESDLAAREAEILQALRQRSLQQQFENWMRLLTAGGGIGGTPLVAYKSGGIRIQP